MNADELTALAIEHLECSHSVHSFEARDLHLHWDDATSSWWMVDTDDLEALGRSLDTERPDAYSQWCTGSNASEVDPESIVESFPIGEDTDLETLMFEAGAADDMISYMALCYLRDDGEDVIRINAEIADEVAA